MKIPSLRIAQSFFFLNALFVALCTGWSVDHGVLSDPEFAMLLVFNLPSTLFALFSILATALIAFISSFFTRDNKSILLSLSLVSLAYYIFLGTQFDLVSIFTLVAVTFLYAAFIGINVVLSYADVNKKFQMAFMLTLLLSALFGFLLWDEQQQRFRLQFENSPESKDLLRAAYKGDTRRVQKLLSEGADIDALDTLGWDALHNAVRGGHVETAQILLENGANPDTHENKEGSTFCIDSECHWKDLVKGNPVIVSAAKIGNVKLVKILIEYGADLYATNTHCESALTVAIRKNNYELIKLL